VVSSPGLRKLWCKHEDEHARRSAEYDQALDDHHERVIRLISAGDYSATNIQAPVSPKHVPLPHGLTCGAKTRAGTPCKRTDLYRSGRCKFHGGLSTGPQSLAGRQKVALNGFKKEQTP